MATIETYHILADGQGRLLEIDEQLRTILGYQSVEIKALSVRNLIPGLILDPAKNRVKQSCYLRKHDGKDVQMECTPHYLCINGGQFFITVSYSSADSGFSGFGLEPILRLILDTQPSNIVLFNKFGGAVWLNKAACATCGAPLSHLIGKNCRILWPDCGVEADCEQCPVFLARQSGRIEQKKRLMPGKKQWRVTAIPIFNKHEELEHVLFIGEDITAHLIIAEEVRQNHKLESLGVLAGGIAHDFNNILSGIMGYADLALAVAGDGNKALKEYLLEVEKAGKRATDLVRQILTFSRRSEIQLVATDLSAIVEEVLRLLRASFPPKVLVKKHINHDVKPVLADPVQMHQVIMNLLTNAGHAMDPRGGELTVTLETADIPEDVLKQNPDLLPGEYLLLSVADTGVGMNKEVLESMFDPYFTTKPAGQGTGLGLSVVHGIVKECGGHIGVESTPGEGTVFSIYLPTVEPLPSRDDKDSGVSMLEGSETILVVDDEPEILKIAKTILELHGYKVLTETNSQRALERFTAHPDEIDLLISDITMPHLTGDRLVREFLAIRPDLPVALMTGYTELSAEQIRKRDKIGALIMKPLGGKNFLVQIRVLLDQKK